MYDVIVRGGIVYDGTGSSARRCDVAIAGGRIAAMAERITQPAAEIIEADGKIVTPGFIDAHTHFDAQVSWDWQLEPVASHGVTTVVMGNCGVGFAPVHPTDHERLIDLMEGVEDIPGGVLHEGIQWRWTSFPEYLDAIDRSYSMDVAAQIPHAPLRLHVMGSRAEHGAASPEDVSRMATLVTEAIEAGAVGFSTSRVIEHQTASGTPVPGTFASELELLALANAVRAAGRGVVQAVPAGVLGGSSSAPMSRLVEEIDLLARIATSAQVPVVFSLMQAHDEPHTWRHALAMSEMVALEGQTLTPMVAPRAPGMFASWASHHAFQRRSTYLKLASLPLAERIAELQRPEIKQRILADADVPTGSESIMANFHLTLRQLMPGQFAVADQSDAEPPLSDALGAIARRSGVSVESAAYDAMCRDEGRGQLISLHRNYADGNYDAVFEMLQHHRTLCGLSDGGAHVRVICDASNPTFMLTFWGRDRRRGPRLPLELLIRKLTREPAQVFGLADRGILAVGKRADVNVIDYPALRMHPAQIVADLPNGGERFIQRASGYVATLVNGVVTRRHDCSTGARPGRLVRGTRAKPA
jgi:N-acyl-D-aspartate/D-glutamate deacylase